MVTKFWLKLEPVQGYSGRQLGWKVVGVNQKQPKTGYSIFMELDVPGPTTIRHAITPQEITVSTMADKIVEELDNGV